MIKKNYLFTLLTLPALLCFGTPNAWGEELTTSGGSTSANLPIYGTWADVNQHNQFVIPASELEDMQNGTITALTMYAKTATAGCAPTIIVSLANVSSSTNLSDGFYTGVKTQVWNGTFTINSSKEWVLSSITPFDYEDGNLLVDIAMTTNGSYNSSLSFEGFYVASGGRYSYNSTNNVYSYVPKMKFTYSPALVSCPKPTLTLDAKDDESASFSWVKGGDETQWQYCYKSGTTEPSEGDWSDPTTSTSTTISGLTASTEYSFYLRAYCDADDHSTARKVTFTTDCGHVVVPSEGKIYGFETAEGFTAGSLPDCWNILKSSSSEHTPATYAYSSGYNNSAQSLHFNGGGSSTYKTIVVLPKFTIDIQNLKISFYYYNGSANSGRPQFAVGYVTDPTDISTYQQIGNLLTKSESYTSTGEINLSSAPAGSYIAICHCGGSYYTSHGYIDNIKIESSQDCSAPTVSSVEQLSLTSARVTWGAKPGVPTYQYCVVAHGAEPDWSGDLTVNTNTVDITSGISVGNEYDFYVKCVCGGEVSAAYNFSLVSCPSVTGVILDSKVYNAVTVNWTTSAPTNCDVRYKADGDANWTSAGTNLSGTSKAITGLVVGKEYSFQVKPNCDEAEEAWGDADETYAPAFPIPAPSTSDITDAQATVSWSALLDNPNYKYIRVAAGSDAPDAEAWESAASTDQTSVALTSLVGGTSYDVYVRAVYAGGEGEPAKVTFTTTTITPTDLTQGTTTTSSIAFSWSYAGAATQFQWKSSKSGSNWSDPISVTNAEETGLSDGESYSFDVRAYYADGIYSSLLSGSFATACAAKSLPYSCGFENSDADVFTNNGYNNCWKRIGSPSASTSSTYRHTGSRGLYFSGTDEQYAILPVFEDAVKGMQISFWYKNYFPTSYASTLVLGSMTDPTDKATFTPIKTLDASSSFVQIVEQSLASAGADDHYIAFKYTGANSLSGVGLDDILVEVLPSCPKPTGVTIPAENITGTTAQVSWTENGSASAWKIQTSADGTNWSDAIAANSNPFTLTGLTPNKTTYYVRVKADCGGGDLSDWSNVSDPFQTECDDIAVDADHEWTENFNNQTANQLPACWSAAGNTDAVNVVESSSYLTLSSKALYFSGGSGSEAIAILPDITTDVNTLQIAFSHVEESKTSSGKVRFGYYKDAAFTALKTCDYSNSSSIWKDEAAFAITGVPSDAKLAFAYKPNYSGYTAAVDNIVISLAASCAVPSEVVGEGLSTSTASISWTAGGEETAWKLQYSTDGENWTDANEGNNITTNPYELTGLSAGTTYYARVKADCGGDLSDWSAASAGFKTDCDAQAMPFEEAFGSTLPECWKMVTVGDNSWAANSSSYYRHSASYSWSYSAYTSADNYSDLITPAIILDEDALLKFYVSNYTYSGTNVVAEVYIQYGSTTTKIFDILTNNSSNTPVQQEIDLSAYTGETAKFIFRAHGAGTSSYKYIYIDDVEVKAKPCDAPTAVNVTASSSDATITWTDETNDKWNFRWHEVTEPANDEWTVVENLDAKSYTISSGLEVGKTYEVQVQSVCPAKTSTWYPTTAKTFELVCSAPTALAVTARTANSATFSWTSSETSWVLQFTTDGENWESENVTVNPFTLEGLAAGTTYQAKIQAACGSDFSNVVEFTTWCGLAEADELPLNEDFSAGAKPACWEFISDTEYPVVTNEKIWFQGENEQIVMLPGYNINLNQLHVSFGFTASNASIELGYYAANGGAFQSLGAVTSGADIDLSTTSAPAAKGYLAIRYYDATSSWSTGSVDNVHVSRQIVLADNADNTETIAAYMNKTVDVTIGRTIVCADYYNTLCLPFSLPTLDGTPLEGGDLWAFKYAKVDESTGELLFRIVEAESIEAGKPYFIAFPSGDPIVNPLFKNVTISATVGQNVGNEEVAQLCGIVDQPVVFTAHDQTKLFLAANNTFYWWDGNSDSRMNAFRAYFKVNTTTSGPSYAPRHGMRARIIKEEQVATGIEDVQGTTVQSTKLLENSQVVIIRNGVKYNLQGQVIK